MRRINTIVNNCNYYIRIAFCDFPTLFQVYCVKVPAVTRRFSAVTSDNRED